MSTNNIFNRAKLIYNCRSHAKGDSQEFKIEEMFQGQFLKNLDIFEGA